MRLTVRFHGKVGPSLSSHQIGGLCVGARLFGNPTVLVCGEFGGWGTCGTNRSIFRFFNFFGGFFLFFGRCLCWGSCLGLGRSSLSLSWGRSLLGGFGSFRGSLFRILDFSLWFCMNWNLTLLLLKRARFICSWVSWNFGYNSCGLELLFEIWGVFLRFLKTVCDLFCKARGVGPSFAHHFGVEKDILVASKDRGHFKSTRAR